MDEQILSEYAALTDVPCDSPLRNIDPDDMFALIFLLLIFSGDEVDRSPEAMKERIQKMIEKVYEKEGGNNDVQPTDNRA